MSDRKTGYGTADAARGVRESGSEQTTRPGGGQLEVDIDLEKQSRTEYHNGGGGKSRPETFQQRAQALTQPPGQPSHHEAPQTMPVQVQPKKKTPAQVALFQMEDAVMRQSQTNGLTKDALWLEAGSLRALADEEVICRHAGSVTDVFEIYWLSMFLMMTNKRVMIKTVTTLFGMNLATVEESFLYSNLQHVAIRRVTNFRYIASGIGSCLVGIMFFGLSAVVWIWALLGIGAFLLGLLLIYWFFIFYNTNTLVLDFSKPAAVGSWWSGKGDGCYIVKSVFLRIDLCFEIMYRLYDHSKTKLVSETA